MGSRPASEYSDLKNYKKDGRTYIFEKKDGKLRYLTSFGGNDK